MPPNSFFSLSLSLPPPPPSLPPSPSPTSLSLSSLLSFWISTGTQVEGSLIVWSSRTELAMQCLLLPSFQLLDWHSTHHPSKQHHLSSTWINKANLVLWLYSTYAMCHAATNLMFRSCITLSRLSPVIESYHYLGRWSVSDSISAIEAPASNWMWLGLCTHYIDHILP